MKAALLDGLERKDIGESLKAKFEVHGCEVSHFRLSEMEISPCRSCGSCGSRTPGQCVIKDAAQEIIQASALSYLLVFITKVTFGGYSSHLKKAVDRLMPLGVALYHTKSGHMLHPMRYGKKFILGLGEIDDPQGAEAKNFRQLVESNGLNFDSSNKILLFRSNESLTLYGKEIDQLLEMIKSR